MGASNGCCGVEFGARDKAPWQYDVTAVNTRAPYIQQYWVTLARMLEAEGDKQLAALDRRSGAEQKRFYASVNKEERGLLDQDEEMYDRINKELVPIIKKSFERHDVSKTGVLSVEESNRFFYDFMQEQGHAAKAIKLYLRFHSLRGLQQTDSEILNRSYQGVLDRSFEGVERQVDRMVEAYANNKAACDAASFKVLDVKRNGRIELDELIAGLMVGSRRFAAFNHALGFKNPTLDPLPHSPTR